MEASDLIPELITAGNGGKNSFSQHNVYTLCFFPQLLIEFRYLQLNMNSNFKAMFGMKRTL